jgi:lysophospholipase L1-like esterase
MTTVKATLKFDKHSIVYWWRGVMFDIPRKFKRGLFFFLFLQLSICTLISLTGCGSSENIPPASILTSGKVTLAWEDIPGATAFNIYISTAPGVTVLNSYKIANATNPFTLSGLEPNTTYYFLLTAEGNSGQTWRSKEVAYTAAANAEGSIQFGDILIISKPKAAVSEFDNSPTASVSESKPATLQEPREGKGLSTRPKLEIIICFGDSLTYGTGAGKGMDYPSQLANMIRNPVINRGIPGDTTSSALRRLSRDVLSKNPDIVLITLGGNDLKNGVSRDIAFGNLKQIVQAIQRQDAKVVIGGLRFPQMDRGFGKGYENLARQTGAVLIPNILAGIAENPNLMADPIHPNNSDYRIIAQRFKDAIVSLREQE